MSGLGGRLEPCGCTSRPLGGVDRVATLLDGLRSDGIPTLVLAGGPLYFDSVANSSGDEAQAHLDADATADILRTLGIDVAAVGAADLNHGRKELGELARRGEFPIVASGARFVDDDGLSKAPEASAILTAGALRVGVFGLVASDFESAEFRIDDPLEFITSKETAALRAHGADLVVALLDGTLDAARAASASADLDLIVLADSTVRGPRSEPNGGSPIVRIQPHGEQIAVIDWSKDRGVNMRTIAVEERIAPNPMVSSMLRRHAKKVNEHNRSALSERAPKPVPADGSGYAGSKPCAACHVQAYTWWVRSSHGRAYLTLVERDKEYNLDCVGCHVTGYGKPGGSTVTRVEGLRSVGCESCHGPGAAHVENPQPPHRFVRAAVDERVCVECHDSEHSDRFDYSVGLEKLRVRGHGL